MPLNLTASRIHWSLSLLEKLLPPDLAVRIPTEAAVDRSVDYSVPPNNGGYIFDGVSGKLPKDLAVDGRIVRVSRRKLRSLCSERIDVSYGHTLQTISTDESHGIVTATFTNGVSRSANILVGCDGPRSTVRNYLFADDDDPRQADALPMDGVVATGMCFLLHSTFVRKHIRYGALTSRHRCFKPNSWRFFFYNSWLGERPDDMSREGLLRVVKEKGSKHAEVSRRF